MKVKIKGKIDVSGTTEDHKSLIAIMRGNVYNLIYYDAYCYSLEQICNYMAMGGDEYKKYETLSESIKKISLSFLFDEIKDEYYIFEIELDLTKIELKEKGSDDYINWVKNNLINIGIESIERWIKHFSNEEYKDSCYNELYLKIKNQDKKDLESFEITN